MKAYQMWESYKEGVGDWSLSYWQELHEDLFSKCLHETGMTFSDERLIVSVEVKVVYPIVWKFPISWGFFYFKERLTFL